MLRYEEESARRLELERQCLAKEEKKGPNRGSWRAKGALGALGGLAAREPNGPPDKGRLGSKDSCAQGDFTGPLG